MNNHTKPDAVTTDGPTTTFPAVHTATGTPGTMTITASHIDWYAIRWTNDEESLVISWEPTAVDVRNATWAVADGSELYETPTITLQRITSDYYVKPGEPTLVQKGYYIRPPDPTLFGTLTVAADVWDYATAYIGAGE